MEETKAPHGRPPHAAAGGRPPLYVRPPTPPPGSTPPPADNYTESRPPPPPLPALTLPPLADNVMDSSQDSQALAEDKEKERNLFMFKKKHLFVELHELRGDEWHETKRYN